MLNDSSGVDATARGRTLSTLLSQYQDDDFLVGDLSAGTLVGIVSRLAAQWRADGVRPGEPVGLSAPNCANWLAAFAAILAAGARPVLLGPDLPEAERRLTLSALGARRCVEAGLAVGPSIHHIAAAEPVRLVAGMEPAVLLLTSGSTGTPQPVTRLIGSLVDEGRRYVRAGYVTRTDRVVLQAPASHAYGLGWMFAGLLARARLDLVEPTALGAIGELLDEDASILVSTPQLARGLARRRPFARRGGHPRLRLVMIGAGPVDAELDRAFGATFGIGLARNYGSTETGAVLAGPAGLAAGQVGTPMPGVDVGLDQGEIVVTLERGDVHRMGDRGERDAAGTFRVLGRLGGTAVRRSGQWISPLEVETALRELPGVIDVHVGTQPASAGDHRLIADVVLLRGDSAAVAELRRAARARMASYKVPHTFRVRRRVRRNATGKAVREPVVVLAPHRVVLETLRANETVATAILQLWHELGCLALLRTGCVPADLARVARVPQRFADDVVDLGRAAGLIVPRAGSPDAADVDALLPDAGPGIVLATQIMTTVHSENRERTAHQASEPAEMCIATDGVHGPGSPAEDLQRLASLIRPGGCLLLEDVFLEPDLTGPGDVLTALEWLGAGATSWWSVQDLTVGLQVAGFEIESVEQVGSKGRQRTLLRARREVL